jgi:hypothetical protein
MGISIYDQSAFNDSDIMGLKGPQGGFAQSGAGGINLETGMPLYGNGGLVGSNIPQVYQNLSNMNGGIVGNGASGGTGMSNSDAFFSSANAPTPSRVVSVKNNAAAGAGYNTQLLNQLLSSYKSQSAKANSDSLAQHADLMKSVGATTDTVNGLLASLGKTGETRIAENEANATGAMKQSLINRGLGNTTIQDSALRGVAKDAENARQQLGESIAGQKIGTQMQLGQMYGDALLSRQNVPPTNGYLSLIEQLAASGGLGGGTGVSRLG